MKFGGGEFKALEMESCLQEVNNPIPPREIICALADKLYVCVSISG